MKRINYSAAVWTAAMSLAVASPVLARGQQPPGTGNPSGTSTAPSEPGGNQAGGPDTTSTGAIGGASDTNSRQNNQQQFIEKAAIANMAEIQLGQLAETHAQDPQVKQFAQMMVTEHTQALDQLKQAAGSAQLPTELDKKHQKVHDKLSKLNGAEFDREYMKAMVDAHKDTASLLEKQAGNMSASAQASGSAVGTSGTSAGASGTTGTSGTSAASAGGSGVAEWAAATLPKVRSHLDQAKSLQDQVKQSAKNNKSDNNGGSSVTGTSGAGTSGTGTSGTGTSGSGTGSGSGAGSGSGTGSGTGTGGTGSGGTGTGGTGSGGSGSSSGGGGGR